MEEKSLKSEGTSKVQAERVTGESRKGKREWEKGWTENIKRKGMEMTK